MVVLNYHSEILFKKYTHFIKINKFIWKWYNFYNVILLYDIITAREKSQKKGRSLKTQEADSASVGIRRDCTRSGLFRVGGVPLQSLEDRWWDWGWCGDGGTLGLETVLVTDVGDLDHLAVRGGVAVAPLGGGAGALGAWLLDTLLLSLDAVARLKTEIMNVC